ncbi:response regulator [Devosia chinhatensis]|uniref:response regulator n=1 Tax=Devosia chinhatensis TaxID=429727 RepID=UPI000A9AB946|nr:response regulator [Devosia chinhatensis]
MAKETITKHGVLIIDPQPHMASLVASMFRTLGRRDIREVNTSSQALTELDRRAYDVIVIDDAVAEPDAVDLVRRLRANPTGINRLAPVIMMSAAPDAASITAARDAGVTEFLRKPFAVAHLQSRLETIASKPRAFIEAETYTGPDRRRRQVDVGDQDRRTGD